MAMVSGFGVYALQILALSGRAYGLGRDLLLQGLSWFSGSVGPLPG